MKTAKRNLLILREELVYPSSEGPTTITIFEAPKDPLIYDAYGNPFLTISQIGFKPSIEE